MFLLLGWNILLLGWNILLLGWNIPCKLASKGRHPSRTIRVGRHLRSQLPDPTVASVTEPTVASVTDPTLASMAVCPLH